MKTYIVTGANQGIGYETVKRILNEIDESFVYLGARNLEKGQNAVEDLIKENGDLEGRVEALLVDISKDESIDVARDQVNRDFELHPERKPLIGLVNNAGVLPEKNLKEGLQVNVYGTKHMTEAFIPLMDEKEGRVVFVSSVAGPSFVGLCNSKFQKFFTNPETTFDELDEMMKKVSDEFNFETKKKSQTMRDMGVFKMFQYNPEAMVPYTFSKACLNVVCMIMAKQYPNLKINSCHPGAIKTSMTHELNKGDEEAMAKKGLKTASEGTVATMTLLTSNDLKGNGIYYGPDGKPAPMIKIFEGKKGAMVGLAKTLGFLLP